MMEQDWTGAGSFSDSRDDSLSARAPLFGRQREFEQLKAYIQAIDGSERRTTTPTVTISGPPGIGKTVLAHAFMKQVEIDYPDFHIYVRGSDFGPGLSDDSMILDLLSQLGAKDSADLRTSNIQAVVLSVLKNKRGVVIIDDISQSSSTLPLLRRPRQSLVILTCRERLKFGQSLGINLTHLDQDESARLVRSELKDVDGVGPEIVDSIVRLTEGQPLTIKIFTSALQTADG